MLHMCCKGGQQFDLDFGWLMKAVRVNCRKRTGQPECPSCPKTAPFFGSCFHNAIGKGLLDISEAILDSMFLARMHNVQQAFFGGWNVEVKRVKKSFKFVVCLQEAKSDMMLYNPDR